MQATVKEVVQESPSVSLIRLVWTGVSDFKFNPGQWVSVWCDEYVDESNKPIRRAFSIASSPGDPYLELCISRGQHLSAYLQDLKQGSKVNVAGPFGSFSLKSSKKCMFIAGGSGIAPFMPMIRQALKQKSKVVLVFSIKTPADFLYRKELESLNIELIPTVTEGSFQNWSGRTGLVTGFLHEVLKSDFDVYLCGPPGMVAALIEKLKELKHPENRIFIDKWS